METLGTFWWTIFSFSTVFFFSSTI